MASKTMKALNYVGPYNVRVEEVEMPKLEHPDDIIVKVTTVRRSKLIMKQLTGVIGCYLRL